MDHACGNEKRLPGLQGPGRLTIDFEHHMRSGGLKVWIEDEKTGQPVGGVRGSADEPK